jgi:hypothetical protein
MLSGRHLAVTSVMGNGLWRLFKGESGVVGLIRAEAAQLQTFMAGLDQVAWARPSACTGAASMYPCRFVLYCRHH